MDFKKAKNETDYNQNKKALQSKQNLLERGCEKL